MPHGTNSHNAMCPSSMLTISNRVSLSLLIFSPSSFKITKYETTKYPTCSQNERWLVRGGRHTRKDSGEVLLLDLLEGIDEVADAIAQLRQ